MGTRQHESPGSAPGRRSDGRHISLSRILGVGEDTLSWSIPLGRFRGLAIRLHVIFPLLAAWELILSLPKGRFGPVHVAIALGVLFLLVLAREAGRWLILRRRALEGDQTILWPLGAFSVPQPVSARTSAWPGAIGGLIVSVALVPVLAGCVLLGGLGADALLFRPLEPEHVVSTIGSLPAAAAWWAYYLNLVVLVLNLLIPMFPLDAGRIAEAVMVRRLGPTRAAISAAQIGMVTACIVVVAALSSGMTRLVVLGIFGAFASWTQYRRASFVTHVAQELPRYRRSTARAEKADVDREPGATTIVADDRADSPSPAPGPERDTAQASRSIADEVDRLLAKISASGIASLTPEERTTLDLASQRMREHR